ncbi:MAG: von Willebrand factor type A domain-containing protein, partial [Planctomycetota bacterium]
PGFEGFRASDETEAAVDPDAARPLVRAKREVRFKEQDALGGALVARRGENEWDKRLGDLSDLDLSTEERQLATRLRSIGVESRVSNKKDGYRVDGRAEETAGRKVASEKRERAPESKPATPLDVSKPDGEAADKEDVADDALVKLRKKNKNTGEIVPPAEGGEPRPTGIPADEPEAPEEESPADPVASGAEPAASGGADPEDRPLTEEELAKAQALEKKVRQLRAKMAVDEILSKLDRRPGETPDMMFFRYWGDSPFVDASKDHQSTFGVDVDTASYTLTRNYLFKRGLLPPAAAVRTEEFVNYFTSHYEAPKDKSFALYSHLAPSPFAHESEYKVLKVGVKAAEVSEDERRACALVFVVDTSGSMRRENRLELVKSALELLVPKLDEGDSIGIVAFDRVAREVLAPTPASETEKILDGIRSLQPNRNTNVDAGLRMGYQMAAAQRIETGNNRVILLSDGVANTGVTDVNGMLANVKSQRKSGIYLTTVGVGMGNHNDALMEQLADRGDGQCVYVDRLDEAKKVFVDNLTGTLQAIARDVKVQVEFDKERVIRYRLLGYENRAIADHRFRDNTVDAGEVGAGHEVVAIYELKTRKEAAGKLATIRLRYQEIETKEHIELEREVDTKDFIAKFNDAPSRFQLSVLAAEYAEVLRDSYWARNGDLNRVATLTQDAMEKDEGLRNDPEVVEFVALVKASDAKVRERRSGGDSLAKVVDAVKENRYLQAQIDVLAQSENDARLKHLEELRSQNDQLRRRLEELLVR